MRISDWSSDVCSSDLLSVGVGLGETLRHDERHVRTDLADRIDDEAIGILQLDLEALVVDRCDGFDGLEQLLAHPVALAPALERREIGRASCRASVCQYV